MENLTTYKNYSALCTSIYVHLYICTIHSRENVHKTYCKYGKAHHFRTFVVSRRARTIHCPTLCCAHVADSQLLPRVRSSRTRRSAAPSLPSLPSRLSPPNRYSFAAFVVLFPFFDDILITVELWILSDLSDDSWSLCNSNWIENGIALEF